MSNPTYCPTCGARDDATERGLKFDVHGKIADLITALEDCANWMESNGDDGHEPMLFGRVIANARNTIASVRARHS